MIRLVVLAACAACAAASLADVPQVEFGVSDAMITPEGGWQMMSAAPLANDFEKYKAQLIDAYNANRGFKSIGVFYTLNCCFATKDKQMLVVKRGRIALDESRYSGGYQAHTDNSANTNGFAYPADSSGALQCNPLSGYDKTTLKFYDWAFLAPEDVFSQQDGCKWNHNPALYFREVAPSGPVADAHGFSFGVYDSTSVPPKPWKLMGEEDFITYGDNFKSFYNANKGLDVIKPFRSGNCCIAVKGGKMLVISGTPYAFQLPAHASTGAVECNPTQGYSNKLAFASVTALSDGQIFAAKAGCVDYHNPAVYMKTPPLDFGIYDIDLAPGDGWQLMAYEDFVTQREEFIDYYNRHRGLRLLREFNSTNCCMAMAGGWKLTVTGTELGFLFPSLPDGGVRCNPVGGYTEAQYEFYLTPTIPRAAQFGKMHVCGAGHNPAVFMRVRTTPPHWEVTAAPTAAPTAPPSLPTWAEVQSSDAQAQAAAETNPEPAPECDTGQWSHWGKCDQWCGPGVHTRRRVFEAGRTHSGLPRCPHTELTQTRECTLQDCALHCKVSGFGNWSACSHQCGGGSKKRTRTIIELPMYDGDACPHLGDRALCNTHACPVHCEVGNWTAYSACSKSCAGGHRDRTRPILIDAKFSGDGCPAVVESPLCNAVSCPSDCTMTEWSRWSECTRSCEGGSRNRIRFVKHEPQFGGSLCGHQRETKECEAQL